MKTLVLLSLMCFGLGAQTATDGPQYSADNQLLLPKDFRQWIYLSTGLGMTYGPAAQADRGNPLFENVFVNPSAYQRFVQQGSWPDKTIFIMEVRKAGQKGSINNAGHYQTEVVTHEAAVKDEARFPQKWAYFGFGNSDEAKALPATSSCNSCHRANGAVENTFVQFYPTLLAIATHKNTLNPDYVKRAATEEHSGDK
jgi:hypothetical protein